jgi:hypothetical protein
MHADGNNFNHVLILFLFDTNACMFKVKKTRSCGHTQKVACYRDLELEPCNEMCTKTQGCGHVCTKLCKQECSPCLIMVQKKIRACGHFVQAPCYYEPSRTDCKENCSLKLKCGHTCKQNCSNVNCESKPCEEFVEPSVGLCGHLIERRCFEKIQGLLISIQF